MAVDRCICRSVPFSGALQLARERGLRRVVDLQQHSPLGTNCGLCIGYMQRVLETGVIDQPVMSNEELALWRARSGCPAKVEERG